MSISKRVYIRWLPDEADEPTSTLVLTAHNRRFVDLRYLGSEDPTAGPEATLEWGFAGSSVGTPSHGVWTHDIDSRRTSAELGEADEGDMFPDPSDPVVTLERGHMQHPSSGEVREYEEAWRDVPVDAPRVSVVETLPGPEGGAQGMIVRVGQFCQGILRVRDAVCTERWAHTEGGGWTLVRRSGAGTHSMPCAAAYADEDEIREGTVVLSGDVSWVVREMKTLDG